MSDKPLFIPLKGRYFDAFADGSKRIEWRRYGPGWNRQVCHRGRAVTLSRGYSGARLSGEVIRTRRVRAALAPQGARDIYPRARYFCAIHVELDSEGMARSARAD